MSDSASGSRKVTVASLDLAGDGVFRHEVVGESHYQPTLQAINQGRLASGKEVTFLAYLMLEPKNPYDSNAVAVHADEFGQIGYLPREIAARVQPRLGILLYQHFRILTCPGKLIGGRPDAPHIGAVIDLPRLEDLPDVIEAALKADPMPELAGQ